MKGIEPSRPAWKAGVLPLNYTRIFLCLALAALFIIQTPTWLVKPDFLTEKIVGRWIGGIDPGLEASPSIKSCEAWRLTAYPTM